MRVSDNGAFVRVQVSRADVARFMQSFPASGLDSEPHFFEFQKSNGDLVDCSPMVSAAGAAQEALCEQAKLYAASKLGLSWLESTSPHMNKLINKEARLFRTWRYNGVQYLALKCDAYYQISDELGRSYGSWEEVERFRKRQQDGDEITKPIAGINVSKYGVWMEQK